MITGNEMRNIGENGVGFTGETVWVDGTDGNQPRFNTVRHFPAHRSCAACFDVQRFAPRTHHPLTHLCPPAHARPCQSR